MHTSILDLGKPEEYRISLKHVLKSDILFWFGGVVFVFLLYFAVQAMLQDANENVSVEFIRATMFGEARYFLWALILLAVLIARRSKGVWTWVLSAFLILVIYPQLGAANLATAIMPNSILYPLIAMLGLLATGRLVEYAYLRYKEGIKNPKLTTSALAVYVAILLAALFFCLPIVYTLIS